MCLSYTSRGNNQFVPKCLVILARIKYMYIVIEQENYCFNIQIQLMHVFLSTFSIIREKLVVNNFLCKYFIKQLNPPCL